MLDLLVKNVFIITGDGKTSFKGNIGVKDGKIATIGSDIIENKKEIDGMNLVATPGFIDIHSHSELLLLEEPLNPYKITQGITTEVMGNCGISIFPAPSNNNIIEWENFIKVNLSCTSFPIMYDIGDYINKLSRNGGTTSNYMMYIGHGSTRISSMSNPTKKSSPKEIETMKEYVHNAMESGAVGVSLGLLFSPGCFSDFNELYEIAKVLKQFNGILACHIRNEGSNILDSIREVANIAVRVGIPLHISHLKVTGSKHKVRIEDVLTLINNYRKRGLDITFDQYPYDVGNSLLTTVLPDWIQQGGINQMLKNLEDQVVRNKVKKDFSKPRVGTWENIALDIGWNSITLMESKTGKNSELIGKSIEDISKIKNTDPIDCVMDLLLEEKDDPHIIIKHMNSRDVERIMLEGTHMVSTDGLYEPGKGGYHPRLVGSFPKFLYEYVIKRKIISLEKAIYHMSYLPAKRLGLNNRGMIKEGNWADLTLFDPKNIRDRATFINPNELSTGIEFVLVNGDLVLEKGKLTGRKPGTFIKYNG
jgi:N-acyl-D-amino-acid deacylase